MAAPHRAPQLKRAWKRTSAAGLPIRRCDTSAFMAVSMLPPAISTKMRATTNSHCLRGRLRRTRSPHQANRAIHSSRRAPTRSARCAMTALEAPATAMATASSRPSWASLMPKVCWML